MLKYWLLNKTFIKKMLIFKIQKYILINNIKLMCYSLTFNFLNIKNEKKGIKNLI